MSDSSLITVIDSIQARREFIKEVKFYRFWEIILQTYYMRKDFKSASDFINFKTSCKNPKSLLLFIYTPFLIYLFPLDILTLLGLLYTFVVKRLTDVRTVTRIDMVEVEESWWYFWTEIKEVPVEVVETIVDVPPPIIVYAVMSALIIFFLSALSCLIKYFVLSTSNITLGMLRSFPE